MRKTLVKVLPAILTVAVVMGLLYVGGRYLEKDYVFWNGSLLPRHEQTLNISGRKLRNLDAFLRFTELRQLDARDTGMTLQQYAWFQQNLPECHVLWDVPIQGKRYSQDTSELHVEMLTEEETAALQYLPSLKLVDLGSWEDYSQIQALKKEYPEYTIRYRVQIGGEWWDSDVVSLVLRDADPEELLEKLVWFEKLESVLLTGQVPGQIALNELQRQYPHIFFLWKMEAMGMVLETDLESLDLPDGSLNSVVELENLLPYFPKLKTVRLSSLGLSTEKLADLAKRHPEIHFVFELTFGDCVLSTDAEEIDISNTLLENTAAVEEILPCFHNLKKVVMCQCGISSEDMDALNRRYEEIRFVWSVNLAGMPYRTDAVHFTPNRWGLSCDNENIYDLRYCTDMVCVDIGHQIKVTNCEWVQFMPELKYLVLAETGIFDLTPLENHENLVFLELFLSKVKDYSPLTTCRALEDLNLCYTQGDPEPIGEMTWLKRLWWSGCWLARKKLADKLPDTYTEYLSLSSTGRGWREGQHYYDMRDFIGMEYMVG